MKNIKKNTNLIIGIAAIVFAAIGFFGGMKYQQSKIKTFARSGENGTIGTRQTGQQTKGATGTTKNARTGFGGQQTGTVSAMDDTSITLKLQDGSSRIVILSGTTTYKKTDEAAKSDVKVGETVAVTGSANTDGSVTAESIQVNPTLGNAMNAPQGNGNAPAPQN